MSFLFGISLPSNHLFMHLMMTVRIFVTLPISSSTGAVSIVNPWLGYSIISRNIIYHLSLFCRISIITRSMIDIYNLLLQEVLTFDSLTQDHPRLEMLIFRKTNNGTMNNDI